MYQTQQKTRLKDCLNLLYCQSGFNIQFVCSSKNCKVASVFICRNNQCLPCKQKHKSCRIIRLAKIIEKIDSKKENESIIMEQKTQLMNAVQYLKTIYRNLIDNLSTDLENMQEWTKHLQLSEIEFYFMKALLCYPQRIKEINGKFINELNKVINESIITRNKKNSEIVVQNQQSDDQLFESFRNKYKKLSRGVSTQWLEQYWTSKGKQLQHILQQSNFFFSGSFIQDAKTTLQHYLKQRQTQNLLSLTVQKRIYDIANHFDAGMSLDSLNYLDLRHTDCIKIEPGLKCLKQLRQLRLNHNKIVKIEHLDSYINLTLLHLGNNQIQKIQNLQKLRQLQFLYLNQNHIRKFENLRQLQNLKKIFFYGNPAIQIKGIQVHVQAQPKLIEQLKSKRVKIFFSQIQPQLTH